MPPPGLPPSPGSPPAPAATSAEWDADRYHRVSDPQATWGAAVLARLRLRGDETVVDAGCGTGRLTAALLDRLDTGRVVAVDRSAAMLRLAARHTGGRAWCVRADLLDLPLRAAADVVFSTATFHWVLDHPRLFSEILSVLRPGGRLLAQCGGGPNLERLHRRAMSVLEGEPYAVHMAGWTRPWEFADAPTAAARLRAAGFVEVRTSVVAAPTVLAGPDHYAEFIRTVILRPHLARLPETLRDGFLTEMVRRGAADDPPWSLDYWRLNLEGRRPA